MRKSSQANIPPKYASHIAHNLLAYNLISSLLILHSRALVWLVCPDSCAHISTSCRECSTNWTRRDGNHTVLVALQHELGVAGSWVPELDSTVLGAGKNPVSVWGKSNRENKVLVNVSKIRRMRQVKHTLCPSKVLMHRPPFGALAGWPPLGATSSHILMVLSKLPDTRSFPFGAKATE